MTINADDFLKAATWIEQLAPEIRKNIPGQFRTVGDRWVKTARRLTREEDAVASGEYLRGWRYRLRVTSGRIPGVARGTAQHSLTLLNEADHARWPELGRGPGRMPPQEPIEQWMALKGIPEEASFPIRRAIATRGTIKRKGYKGFEIMRRSVDEIETWIFAELDEVLDRALLRLQSMRR